MDKLGINLPWFLAQFINFLLVLVILRTFAYKPILNMLETRRTRIKESLEYADKVKLEAAQQQQDFERRIDDARREAQAAAQSGREAAEKERQRILAEAQVEAEKIKTDAKGQIEVERRQMMSELRSQVVDLSMLGAQRVIGASLDERKSRQLVEDFLTQVESANGQPAGAS